LTKTYPDAPYGWLDMRGRSVKAYDKQEIDELIERLRLEIETIKEKSFNIFYKNYEHLKYVSNLKTENQKFKKLLIECQNYIDKIIKLSKGDD